MSVIGFDIGNENLVVAVARCDGIDVLLNDEAKRETTGVVSFGDKQRFFGSAGAAFATANPKSTISQVKRLMGRQYKEPSVQDNLKFLPYATSEGPRGGILIELEYMAEKMMFTPLEILGMLFKHLKQVAEKNLEYAVVDCVIGIPSYFTDLQRREYLDAATIAGLKPLTLIHDGTAIALGYGMYKTDLDDDEPIVVVFVDIGHADTQVTVAEFEQGNFVMAILVISISSDSSEDSVGTPAGRVILFETPIIAPTIPPSPDYTPASLDYSPASDSESDPSEDPSSDHIPPLPAISPFLSSDDDTTDSDTPDTPISPTHDTPFTEITASTQRSPIHTSSSSYDSITWTAILPWSTASSDFHSDASSDPSLRHPLSDHSLPDLPSTYARPSSKRRRSPMTSVPALSPVSGALSPYALRDRGIDARVVVEAVDRDETETGVRGLVKVGAVEVAYETLGDLVQRFYDHTQAIPVHRIQAIEEVQKEQGYRIVGVESAVIALTERIAELEEDKGGLETPRVLRVRELTDSSVACHVCRKSWRQMRRLRFYDRVRVGRLEACARKHMGYHP
ncbi:heat shock 70 kDa protein 16 [Tanacetum coccineum]